MEPEALARPKANTVRARPAGLPTRHTGTQVEEEEGLNEDSLPEQPLLWELWVSDPQTGEQLCVLRSDDSDASEACALCKSEPVYTTNVELLLEGLQEPLQVVHTVDPRDAEQCIEKWMPSIHKEIGVIEKAVRRLASCRGPFGRLAKA